MKILYSCSFDLEGYKEGGATRQKLKILNKYTKLRVISLNGNSFKLLQLLFIEFKTIVLLLKNKPQVFISRGFVGYFSQKIAKFLKVKTVREVHADAIEEVQYYDKNFIEKFFILLLAKLFLTVDLQSDMRIFNHPHLLKWFRSKYFHSKNDFFCYNGFDFESKSSLSKKQARKKFKFGNKKYLIFTGSSSFWHGVSYLSNLQKSFNKLNANIQIVCGGGKVNNSDDPGNILKNISPLNGKDCADLIMAADACILPARQSRISPGSPLKLYDYILHKKPVITVKNLKGYSDEVLKYKNGILVDFSKSHKAAKIIINTMKFLHKKKLKTKINNFSWDQVIFKWIKFINILIKKNPS